MQAVIPPQKVMDPGGYVSLHFASSYMVKFYFNGFSVEAHGKYMGNSWKFRYGAVAALSLNRGRGGLTLLTVFLALSPLLKVKRVLAGNERGQKE